MSETNGVAMHPLLDDPPATETVGTPAAVVEIPSPNVAVAGPPRVPRLLRWLDLPDDYAGLRVRVWVNCPNRLIKDLRSGNEAAEVAARAVIVEHNGWLDPDGEPYPPPTDQAFWDAIPTELAALIFGHFFKEVADRPQSLLAKLAE